MKSRKTPNTHLSSCSYIRQVLLGICLLCGVLSPCPSLCAQDPVNGPDAKYQEFLSRWSAALKDKPGEQVRDEMLDELQRDYSKSRFSMQEYFMKNQAAILLESRLRDYSTVESLAKSGLDSIALHGDVMGVTNKLWDRLVAAQIVQGKYEKARDNALKSLVRRRQHSSARNLMQQYELTLTLCLVTRDKAQYTKILEQLEQDARKYPSQDPKVITDSASILAEWGITVAEDKQKGQSDEKRMPEIFRVFSEKYAQAISERRVPSGNEIGNLRGDQFLRVVPVLLKTKDTVRLEISIRKLKRKLDSEEALPYEYADLHFWMAILAYLRGESRQAIALLEKMVQDDRTAQRYGAACLIECYDILARSFATINEGKKAQAAFKKELELYDAEIASRNNPTFEYGDSCNCSTRLLWWFFRESFLWRYLRESVKEELSALKAGTKTPTPAK